MLTICVRDGSLLDRIQHSRRDVTGDVSDISNATRAFELVPNRGPLLTTALALFGSGSFIAERMTRPEAYLYPNVTWEESKAMPDYGVCVGKIPFIDLLLSGSKFDSNELGCLKNTVHNHDDLQHQLTTYVQSFYYSDWDGFNGERIVNAFTAAAYVAHEVWLTSSAETDWTVDYDYGADTIVPTISLAGIITISVLMGVFLTMLLALAIYGAVRPRWADQLDAFAMLRIGASIHEEIKFRQTQEVRKIKVLDRLPGWIGDATEGEGERGRLALGAMGRLNWKCKFVLYDDSDDGIETEDAAGTGDRTMI